MEKDLQKEYERIQKYAENAISKMKRYTMYQDEIDAIYECSVHPINMIILAFSYGFEKGCRATKKAVAK